MNAWDDPRIARGMEKQLGDRRARIAAGETPRPDPSRTARWLAGELPEGEMSNEVQIALGQAAPPQPPLALLATVQGTAVTLQWTENPLGGVISSYQLQAGTASGLVDVGVFPLTSTTRTLSVNAPPGTYFVRLVAEAHGGRISAADDPEGGTVMTMTLPGIVGVSAP